MFAVLDKREEKYTSYTRIPTYIHRVHSLGFVEDRTGLT